MIIVTGGAGFIGSNIVKALNKKGVDDILIVDDLRNSVKHLNMNSLSFLDYVDRLDFINSIDKFDFKKVDLILHQGACSDTTEYNGQYMMSTNYEYSKVLFNKAIEKNLRFIYASSAAVYGNGENGFLEKRECEYPLNIYAYSKFLFDQYVRKNIKRKKKQVVGLRYFNVFGYQENHKEKMASVVFHFFNQIKKDGKIRIFAGSKDFKRDFIFIDDVVNVVMHFYKNAGISGIYNCGTGRAESFLKIANKMQALFKNVKTREIPFPENLKGKYQKYTKADLSLLRQEGKYKEAFTGLEEGVEKYVEVLKKTNGYIR